MGKLILVDDKEFVRIYKTSKNELVILELNDEHEEIRFLHNGKQLEYLNSRLYRWKL